MLSKTHGRDNTAHSDTGKMLDSFPDTFWTKGGVDVGLIPVTPMIITLNPGIEPVYRPRYPLKQEQVLRTANTIDGLLKAGVLERTRSPWNTPISPVPKPD